MREVKTGILPGSKTVLQTGTHIVVGGGTPEVGNEFGSLLHEVAAADAVFAQIAVVAVELDGEVLALHLHVVILVVLDDGSGYLAVGRPYIVERKGRRNVGRQGQLVFGHHMTSRKQVLAVLELIAHIEQPLAFALGLTIVQT